MSSVLIDSSAWIAFFKGDKKAESIVELVDSNRVCTNNLILSELIPSIIHKKETHLVELFHSIHRLTLEINWEEIIKMQSINLKKGINRVGIPDLIIGQNAILNGVELFTFDKHFELMSDIHGIKIFTSS